MDIPKDPDVADLDQHLALLRQETIGVATATFRTTNDVLPRGTLTKLGEIAGACWRLPSERPEMRQRWTALARAAVERPRDSGFIRVPSGGIPRLAERLGVPESSLCRSLTAWEGYGHPSLVRRHRSSIGGRSIRPVIYVDIPLLGELMRWLAERHLEQCLEVRGALTWKQIHFLVLNAAECQQLPWHLPNTRGDATLLIGEIKGTG